MTLGGGGMQAPFKGIFKEEKMKNTQIMKIFGILVMAEEYNL